MGRTQNFGLQNDILDWLCPCLAFLDLLDFPDTVHHLLVVPRASDVESPRTLALLVSQKSLFDDDCTDSR
jgi:hypothetical protein